MEFHRRLQGDALGRPMEVQAAPHTRYIRYIRCARYTRYPVTAGGATHIRGKDRPHRHRSEQPQGERKVHLMPGPLRS